MPVVPGVCVCVYVCVCVCRVCAYVYVCAVCVCVCMCMCVCIIVKLTIYVSAFSARLCTLYYKSLYHQHLAQFLTCRKNYEIFVKLVS